MTKHTPAKRLNGQYIRCLGCLFGLAVECANARLSTRPGLISCTEPGTNPTRGAKIKSGAYVVGLISWAASEGSTMSSLISDRWLTHKLATFMGSTDSLEHRFSCQDRRSVLTCGCWAGPIQRTCEEGAEPSPCCAEAGLVANL